nr:retrovirus-related Pol polyprotein from transposon TNT 1-94 [Tanacetum cinerariifolium]
VLFGLAPFIFVLTGLTRVLLISSNIGFLVWFSILFSILHWWFLRETSPRQILLGRRVDLSNRRRNNTCKLFSRGNSSTQYWEHFFTSSGKITLASILFPTASADECMLWHTRLVTNDFSRFTWNFFLKSKDETSGILKKFFTEIENLKDLKVKIIRCDNGREFKNKEMNDFGSQKGIKREFRNARTPQQNGVAERRNRTLIEAARTMLADAKLPVTFWAEAVNTACYVQNRVLVNKSHNKTPYELFNGRSPAIGFLKPFGCHVMILNTLNNLGKFEEKGMTVTLLDTQCTKDATSQEVKKDASSLRYIALPNWAHDALLEFSSSKPQDHCCTEVLEGSGNPNPTTSTSNLLADPMETLIVETPIPSASLPVPTAYSTDSQDPSSDSRLISKRVTNQEETPSLDNILSLTNRFEDILGVTTNSDESNRVEANISNMETAITASPTPTLKIHKDHPKSQIIGPLDTPIQTRNKSKEVLKNKKDERGMVIRNKAMLVAQGHTQEEGIEYDEVFAPVARIEAIRLFLAYASFIGFIVYQMDVKSAFLYGTIDEEALRAWYGTLSKYLLKNDFQRGTIDQTLFIRRQRGDFILVQVYVDDIIFGSSNPQLCREFEALMHEKFQMSAMGDILKKFGYSDVKSSNTPMDKENPWGKDGTGKDVDLHLYRSMIGSLMYLTASRPDIMFAVSYLDSDYGGATQDRKSTTRGCQFLGRRLISWQCKKQTIVATLTTKAEYVAAASCCGQVLWIQNQLLDYGLNMPCEALSKEFSTSILRLHYTRRARIAQCSALPTVADRPASPLRDVSQWEAFPTDFGFIADQDRATIDKSSTLPYDSAPRVTSPVAVEGSMQQTIPKLTALCTSLQRQLSELTTKFQAQEVEINRLKERVKLLEDIEGVAATRSGDDALIKGRSMDEGEAATERISDDLEEMATVLTSMDAATVLASRVVDVPTSSGSIPTASTPAEEQVHTGSDVVPTASLVFATATVVTPYRRRKGKEVMLESETSKKQIVQEQIDTQIMIDGLDRNNETVAKYLQEYHQFTSELPIERRIELITDLVRSNLGWKVKDFRGMTFKEVEAKFNLVWKQMEDFIPIGSREEAERIKRKGLSLKQKSAKKQKTSEEVTEEAKSSDEVLKDKVKEMMQLVPIEEVYVEALQVKHPIINWKHLDREDLNQLWRLVKETLSNRPSTSDKEMELWVELSRLYEPDNEDQLWSIKFRGGLLGIKCTRAINKVPLAFNSFFLANFSYAAERGYDCSTSSIVLFGKGSLLIKAYSYWSDLQSKLLIERYKILKSTAEKLKLIWFYFSFIIVFNSVLVIVIGSFSFNTWVLERRINDALHGWYYMVFVTTVVVISNVIAAIVSTASIVTTVKGLKQSNGEALRKCILSGPYKPTTVLVQAVAATDDSIAIPEHTTVETPMNMSQANKAHFEVEKEAIHLILTGIRDEIYSTVDACQTAQEIGEAIERLQQSESLNIQDVKTNLFWEFGKFTSHEGETMESYYTRFYKLMNEMIRNNLTVATMQVNVQFLQQFHQNGQARNANPLALVATAQANQEPYYQTSKSHKSYAPSSKPLIPTRTHTSTIYKGKEIAKPITPLSETASEEDNDPERAQRDKDMQKNSALIAMYIKKIYKPTNNNIRTSSNSRNKNVDTTSRPVVQQSGIHCFNYKESGHFAKECRKPKGLKTPHTDEEIDEQELKAHYSYMTKIQKNGQNDVESNDERAALANLIANLKLDVHENKMSQKQLKKANKTLAQELKECKTILAETSKTLGESNSVPDSCLVALQNKKTEFEKYKAFNDRTVDYDKLERKLNETLGQLAQKDIEIKEGLKTKDCEISVVKEKHDELIKQSLLTKSHYEGLVKQKTKVIMDLKLNEEHDIDKMLSMEKQLKFLNEIVYKRSQSI